MYYNQKKLLYVFLPFIVLLVTLLLINILSTIDSDPMDSFWTTRQLVIGLFIFTSSSFIPGFLHLAFHYSYPWVSINLSHHRGSHSVHELNIKGNSICTGCLGSTVSIILANSSLIIYFYFPSFFLKVNTSILLVVGFILVMVTYSRYFKEFGSRIRLLQHSTLFTGISFLIIVEDMIFRSALFMVLLLPSWITFLLVRVKLSKIDHLSSSH
ncbi:MAG: hypothetical protein ACW97Z_02370 [Candidatus Hodarchaeales archaeon]|jgi:hypothetical protein